MFDDFIIILTVALSVLALLIVAVKQKQKDQPWTMKQVLTVGGIVLMVVWFMWFFWMVGNL